jgi:hypothetical protein
MSNMLRIDIQNVLDYTENSVRNVLDKAYAITKETRVAFQIRCKEAYGRYIKGYRQ